MKAFIQNNPLQRIATILFTWFALVFAVGQARAQCNMSPLDLSDKVASSELVIEGQVVSKESTWDDNRKLIYTIYKVEVWAIFKGNLTSDYVYFATKGGVVDMDLHTFTGELELNEGKTGVFMLLPTHYALTRNYPVYEAFGAKQGFIRYSKDSRQAFTPFTMYNEIENELYPAIQKYTGATVRRVKNLNWESVNDLAYSLKSDKLGIKDNHDIKNIRKKGITGKPKGNVKSIAAGASITSFSPTTVQGGRNVQLTINGSGFGATQGTSYVLFAYGSDGGSSFVQPLATQYISWSDTQIVVEVPDDAGTGKIKVSDGTTTKQSASNLTVEYSISNIDYTYASSTKAYQGRSVGMSGGGYSFQMYTGFASNTSAVTDFQNVIYQWRCATGINWTFGSNTSTNSSVDDDINIVRFDVGTELATGILGQCGSYYTGCLSGSTLYWYLSEMDVTIDSGTSYFYGSTGSPSVSQYDFYTVMLHEMGHGHQLAHVIDATKTMHYSIGTATQKRTLSTAELTGAAYHLTQSTGATSTQRCSQSVHVDRTCSPTVTLSASSTSIAENGGTSTITATLNKIAFSDVTVTLAKTGTTVSGDYTLGSTTITISAGNLTGTTTLTGVNDAVYEGSETVILDISAVTNGTESGTQQVTVTLTDDESMPTVTLSASTTTIGENGGTSTITATLSGTSAFATTVTLTRSGTATVATDYTLNTSITIAAGSTTGSLTLTGVNDATIEGNETVIIDITGVTNATENGTQQLTVTITDDDAPTVTLTTGTTSISENGGTTTVTATRSASVAVATTVTLSFSGTATVTSDYTLATTITIPSGSTSASITLTGVNDAIYEGSETVIIDIASITNGTESGTQQRTVALTDDESVPAVTLSTGATSISENGGTTTVTATLSNASASTVTVSLVLTGTATVTTDYTLATTITVAAGSTTGSITLTAVNNAVYGGDENVVIDIASVTNGTESGTQQKIVVITDDESLPTVTLSSSSATLFEGGSTISVTATLSHLSSLATTSTLTLAGTSIVSTDYTLATSIIVPAGSLSASITLTSLDDAIYEGNESVNVSINTVTNGTENGTQQINISHFDNDTAPTVTLALASTSKAENASPNTVAVTATISAVSGVATTVTCTATGTATSGTDYSFTTSIVVPAGSTSASNNITLIDDVLYEGNETVIVNITGVTNGTESGTQSGTLTITDNETVPTVTLSATPTSINENGGTSTITATLNNARASGDVTVTLSLSGTGTVASDYTLSTSITITAGNTTGSITLTGVNDAVYEGNETVIADISSVTNGTESGTQQATVTLLDDEVSPTVTLSASIASIVENGGSTTVTATLNNATTSNVTVNLAFSGTATVISDYTLATSIIITAGNTTGAITLASVDNTIYEGNETVIIDIASVTNATESGTQQQTVTITENETLPTVTLSTNKTSISETLGESATITATLSGQASQDVTVTLSLTGTATVATDYTLPTTITITAGNTTGTATLTAINDVPAEGNETVVIDITAVSAFGTESGVQQHTVTIVEGIIAPVISSSLTSSGTYKTSYTYNITATNSPTAYNATGLPAGLSINTATGEIAGLPTTTGTFNVSISATNAGGTDTQTLVLTVGKVTLTVTGATADNKAYDGTTTATISNVTLSGVISGDNVTVSGGGTFSDANIGTGKSVTTNLVLGGTEASNYILTQPTGLTASIVYAITSAKRGNAMTLDGTGDYIEVPYSASLNPSTFTVETWVKVTSAYASSMRSVLSSRETSSTKGYGYSFLAGTPANSNWHFFLGENTTNQRVNSNVAVTQNEWTHLAATYDGSTLKVYVNGVLTNTVTPTAPPNLNNAQPLYFGARRGNSGTISDFCPCLLDEVRVWNNVRTQAQIRENMHLTLSSAETNLVGYFQFNETSGSSRDAMAGHTGTLYGDAVRSASTLTVGSGTSKTTSVTSVGAGSEVSIGTTGMEIDFKSTSANPNGEIVVTQITAETPYNNTSSTTNTTTTYWVVRNFGTNTGLAFDNLKFQVSDNIGSTDEITPSNLKLYHRTTNSGTSAWTQIGTANSASNTTKYINFNSPTNTTFSEFIIGSSSGALPITLLGLKGERVEGLRGEMTEEVRLEWATANEINNKGFEVEMSTDGLAYEKIAFVEGAGNSISVKNYELSVKNGNDAYYRLRQVDFDGKFSYSPVVFVEGLVGKVSVYPNPSRDYFMISIGKDKLDSPARLLNAQGVEVWQGVQTEVRTTGLPTGMYFLHTTVAGKTKITKVVIER